jgi:hypothetical protein
VIPSAIAAVLGAYFVFVYLGAHVIRWSLASPLYTLVVAAAVRFLHFALFEEPLLEPLTWVFETTCLIAVALLSWRFARAGPFGTGPGCTAEKPNPHGVVSLPYRRSLNSDSFSLRSSCDLQS